MSLGFIICKMKNRDDPFSQYVLNPYTYTKYAFDKFFNSALFSLQKVL